MNAPEAYVHFTPALITDNGKIRVESTEQFLPDFMQAFHDFVVRVRSIVPQNAYY